MLTGYNCVFYKKNKERLIKFENLIYSMDFLISMALTFLIGVIASFLGAVVGGGGLVSVPFLIFLGLPPNVAVATNKMGSIGLGIGAIPKFWKGKKIIWKWVPLFTAIAVIGGYTGANFLVEIDPSFLQKIISIIILFFVPVIFLKKEAGIKRKKTGKYRRLLGLFLYFIVMVYAGFFGGGAGILIFYTLIMTFGFTIIESNATDIIPWLVQAVIAFIIFAFNGLVDYWLGSSLLAGMILGGYIGAHTAVKKGNEWVKIFFAIIITASVIKLLFFG